MKPINSKDFKRLESLHQLHILDTPRQASFDRITELCADIFGCSISLISLVDEHRQWFLSSVGVDVRETPREISFCNHTIAAGCSFLVPDASLDDRFSDNPLVHHAPAIRSYLGAPIRSPDGELIGTLCIADQRAGCFNENHIFKLENLAATVEDLIGAHSQASVTSYLNSQLGARSSRLNRANRVFKQAEKIAKIGSWEWDLETHELTWSEEAFAIFGAPKNAPMSIEETFLFYAKEDQQRVMASVANINNHQESFEFEAGLNAADGTFKRVKAMGEYLEADQQTPARLVGIIQDITESHHTRLALQRAADRDALTDLYNRNALDRFLQDTLGTLKKTGSNAFLLMLDLDGFKDINDTFGHLIGDVFLEKISSRIVDALPEGAIVARWGGDEFVILTTPDISLDAAKQFGDEILLSVERQFEISGRKMGVSATCGLVEIDERSIAREIIRKADLALYHGKEREPGRVHIYVPELEEANHHRQAAIATVREALDHNRIFAGYQPIIDLATNRLVGLEALMRLSTPSGEQMTASEVLPALLDPILSREIGERMLSCVCRDLAEIEQTQPDLQFVSINATEADLLSRDFTENLLSKLQEFEISPGKITLEVTETMLMVNDTTTVQNVLSELSGSGMRIALDDFGTGFSSLSHLRDFPIDAVKIDKSFIRSITAEHQSRLIVQALINMASNLGIEVIAEGVETEDQRTLLLQIGCHRGQGFLISPAQSACRIKSMRFPNALIESLGGRKVA
ncbi:putative bifunctional diguanylate cyclase/phosphodiesterase [Parasphingorhabdus sp.]|uniref:putative bifunctional diguanylate cyclase/phosphodiesterase n=1 Tax=Parasphingorhabdus sp. TaxID=2709688 RepID=UPI0035932BEB